MINYRLALMAAVISGAATVQAQDIHRQDLCSGWQFRQARGADMHTATVPGTVHTDLMDNDLIPNPFIGRNERMVQWVDKEDWVYETTFDLDSTVVADADINLVFDGLDTYADVYLNDSLVLKADNMFRRYTVPARRLLRPFGNRLKVYLHSPIKVDMPKFDALPFSYEAGNDQSENGGIMDKRVSVFARKAGYHYGWDWGPRLVTSGIWRPVYLQSWSGPRIADVFVRTMSLARDKASMQAEIEVEAPSDMKNCELEVRNLTDGRTVTRRKLTLDSGMNRIALSFEIKNPRLWWCNGLGKPDRYDFEVTLASQGRKAAAHTVSTGIRTIELVRDDDSRGRSFYFRLNGVPVFAKGANYIPCDNFLPRVTPEIYRRTIQDAADANMNMLRVWGGGIYEDDCFYNLCDSLGIMVWQDFMFACSMYPAEGELLENIRLEAEDNVRRLRNHPSVALWCGNNECLEAWYNWGWKRRYTKKGVADTLWRQYTDVYHDLLPRIVADLAPDVDYTPSSPFSRIDGSPQPDRGDFHMWRVWGGGEPVSLYNQVRSRFFSEYGFQSFPEIGTVRKYAPDSADHRIDGDVMLSHQRAGAGANKKIEQYLLQSYPQPKDFESFLYMSQVLQGDAIRTAIEAHRRDMPYCMGSLFWQHNDCWPVASWSSRDYYGNWKAQHYYAAKAYRDVMLSTVVSGDSVRVYTVSDRRLPATGTLSLTVGRLDGKGQPLYCEHLRHDLDATSVTVTDFSLSELIGDTRPEEVYLLAEYTDGSGHYDNITLPVDARRAALAQPEISLEISGTPGNYSVDVTSDVFVRAFRMVVDGNDGHLFTDNYFDLLPGKNRTIGLRSTLPIDSLRRALSWTSVKNASKTFPAHRLVEAGPGYCKTSVNAAVFRGSSVISHGDNQYLAYYDPDGYVTIARRTLGSSRWQTTRSPYRGNVRDGHNVISIGVDGDNYLHVSFDHHGDSLRYCRSVAPGSTVLGPLEAMTGRDESDVTYPDFHSLPDGDLLFAYRSGASGCGNLVLNRYDTATRRWHRVQDVLIDGQGRRNAYWQMHVDAAGTIHLSWVWRETWLVETNHDLCFARSTDGGLTWQRSDGSAYTLPITADNAETAWRIPQNSNLINQTGMTADSQGHPYIATYWADGPDAVTQYRLVWHDGRQWRMSTVGQRSGMFSLAGGGTKMIPISRPRIASDGKAAYYIFRDSERGSGVSMAYTPELGKTDWTVSDLTDFPVDAWEPSYDTNLWNSRRQLHIYVQRVFQGDGEQVADTPCESTPVYVLECL